MKPLIECVKVWLKDCPNLSKIDIRTDFLKPDNSGNDYFSLEQSKTPSPFKKNVLGTKIFGNLDFNLAGCFSFGLNEEKIQNDNLLFMQEIEIWILEQARKHNYPKLNDNEIVTGLEITSSPFLYGLDKNMNYSRYDISLKIKYERKI